MITYGYTILYVADVEKTIAFYVSAFGFTQKFITPEKDYSELDTGFTTLAFGVVGLFLTAFLYWIVLILGISSVLNLSLSFSKNEINYQSFHVRLATSISTTSLIIISPFFFIFTVLFVRF